MGGLSIQVMEGNHSVGRCGDTCRVSALIKVGHTIAPLLRLPLPSVEVVAGLCNSLGDQRQPQNPGPGRRDQRLSPWKARLFWDPPVS